MYTLFSVRRGDGKFVAQHFSRELAEREVEWHRASGTVGPFSIETVQRDNSERAATPYALGWSSGAPRRFSGKWPAAKLRLLEGLYKRGVLIKFLVEYFGTNAVVLHKLCRKHGWGYRHDPNVTEQFRGRWTEREDQLINYMYDEGISIGEISEAIGRTRASITNRLGDTARTYSKRTGNRRFVTPDYGRKDTIWSVLESPGEHNEFVAPRRDEGLLPSPEVLKRMGRTV